MWEKMLDLFAKVNEYIPLDALFWAGVAVVGVVFILAVLGCILRKRWNLMWLPWLYFTFATLVIFATPDIFLNGVVINLEYPVLVVLVCYVLLLLFRRCPRYTYVKQEVYVREVAKQQKEDKVRQAKQEKIVTEKAAKEEAVKQ